MAGWQMVTGLGALAAVLLACAPRPEAEVSGRALFDANCAVCHGPGGRGDGPAAAGLDPAPIDLTLLSRGNGGSFPTVAVMSYIDGYDRETPQGTDGAMPAFGAGLTNPDGAMVLMDTGDGVLTPTPAALAALAAHLESLQR